MILKGKYNHVEEGKIKRYKDGDDVSHLPDEVKKFLADNNQVEAKTVVVKEKEKPKK